jgi:hypothetical protein
MPISTQPNHDSGSLGETHLKLASDVSSGMFFGTSDRIKFLIFEGSLPAPLHLFASISIMFAVV